MRTYGQGLGNVHRAHKPRDRWTVIRPKVLTFDTIWFCIEVFSISFTAAAMILLLLSFIFQ